ncbi:tRNA epoxyqueuosine(34) reductase QueG [Geosporobacter ferrireducens]|uniref:tRNA epoxyqueuosine(34) reductase QueG n=1 Tax=Geosporobacter ferrireducens TaxID=1424294 RepID=A0A1D8GN68_9FIRM|nr:tRNA epoxyqueuosine(34) reductase QueG [Geosporobacter ferrireducens]AOT72360.1 tRNA epoxyqueuosine(34) reductase QueG [Geosporobacter ferrireducens]
MVNRLKEKIKICAKDIGIDLIGFTSAAPFNEIKEILMERKEKGYLSGFEEQDIGKRIDPKQIMPDARTIIAIAINYYVEKPRLLEGKERPLGAIARSAWGRDYHEVLRDKLLLLMQNIEKLIGPFQYKIYVDTGSLSDRAVAWRAGLGWFGKNNMLITKKYGSWVFLGYAIVNFEVEPDQPMPDQCAGCNACIQACPAEALEEGYKLQGKKCLSFITQTKEDITPEVRQKMGNRLYGCDTCQCVCPHNHTVEETKHQEFSPEAYSDRPDLIEILHMDNKTFKVRYGKTAAGWRGKNNIRRNAIIALANRKDPLAIPHLKKLLFDESNMIRKYAIWAIIKLDAELARSIIKAHLENEKDEEIREIIEEFLGDDSH